MEKLGNRNLTDRRKQPTPALSRYTLFGRRMGIRRRDDQQKGGYVDRYDSGLFYFLVFIITFNILDALFTMKLLEMGAWEANPIVQALMDLYGDKFWLWKFAIVSFSLILLCLHSQFRRVKAFIISISFIYFTVVFYQIFLVTFQ